MLLLRTLNLFRFRPIRFLFSGGVGFVTVLSMLYILTDIVGIWYLFSFVIAFLIGTTVSFVLQKFFTFGDGTFGARRVSGQAAVYISLAVFNLGVNSLLLYLLVEYAGLHYLVVQFFVSLMIAVWNFLCYRYIFRSIELQSAASSAAPYGPIAIRPREFLMLIGACSLAMTIAFSVSGLYNDRIDTAQYVGEIAAFQALIETGEPVSGRALFKPLPGLVGALLSYLVQPYTALLLINISLVVGFVFALYGLLREVSFDPVYSAIGASWAALAYPVLKYGFGLGTDAWGWFAATLVVFLALRAVRTERLLLLVGASVIGFLGSLAKETAVLGLLFAGVYVLAMMPTWQVRKTAVWLAALSIPFFTMQLLLLGLVLASGGPTFLDWYAENRAGYSASHHHLDYFAGVMFSSFNALLIFAFIGVAAAWQSGDLFRYSWLRVYAPLVIATTPVLLWPIFISRIVFIQALWVIPLGLLGARWLAARTMMPQLSYGLFLLPPAAAIALYFLSGNGSLFEALAQWV
ncbi:MAG TPA: GtrA family protein [Candidatus Paceibacterota bacterium]|nr:GtrA family protein [Candidatus Paceibacterota bacterium]